MFNFETFEFNLKNVGKILLGVLLVIIIILSKFWFIVEPGEVGLIKQLGNLKSETYSEGMHFKVPFIQSVKFMSIKEVKEEIKSMSASKDLQDVTTQIAINYYLNGKDILNLFRTVGDERTIKNVLVEPAIRESIKAATAEYTASELITKRSEVRESIIKSLKNKLEKKGIVISSVNITDFKFSSSFNQAIEDKVRAEQQAQKAENDLKRVEFETQQEIKRAEAEAKKIQIQAKAITAQGGKEYVQLQAIEKWDGKLPQYMLSSDKNNMFLNLNTNK